MVELLFRVLMSMRSLCSYVGMETGYGAFIPSYAVIYLKRTEAEGQLLASAYWGAMMIGRIGQNRVAFLAQLLRGSITEVPPSF